MPSVAIWVSCGIQQSPRAAGEPATATQGTTDTTVSTARMTQSTTMVRTRCMAPPSFARAIPAPPDGRRRQSRSLTGSAPLLPVGQP